MRLLAVITEANKEEKTELLYGIENAVRRGAQFMQNIKIGMDLFGDKNGPSIIMEYDVYKNNYIDVIRRGGKIRLITEITKENIHYCKELMKIVTELRHLDGLVGGIAVSESEYMTTTTLKQKQLLTQVFYSNATEVVKQGQRF
jgi:two-component system sensor histidine kinase VicK